ncbi:TlpA disulfide reductase family protein [Bacteroides sp. 224]|uniref:TlpA family protein disulfide reductase n=1 Tax=Bacteroides sp. 224 TaxID=2302936 RepID=UPI0013D27500|nr:TlpA disulfide reductase family protein [Bacteroides sp. 224]NDV66292.1 TlpA family protein disulfide reductase [Bacteroides sp. 224]
MKALLKNSLAIFLLIALSLLQSCDNYPKVIENPEHGLKNTPILTIDKIELTDTTTIFHFTANFRPRNWITIAADTYLKAGNEKFVVTAADSIALGERHWMSASGKDSFVLYFPALPKGTKSVDFIESDCDDCFKIWDIDLTGKGIKYTPDMPKEVLNIQIDKTAELPAAELKTGKTILNVHFTGLKEGYKLGDPQLILNDVFLMTQHQIEPQSIEGKTYRFEFVQNATTNAFLIDGSRMIAGVILSPGETADVYIDFTAKSINDFWKDKKEPIQTIGYKGKYASLNLERSMVNTDKYMPEGFKKNDGVEILDMAPQDWVNKKKQEVAQGVALIQEDKNLSPAFKTHLSQYLKAICMSNVTRIKHTYEWAYREKNKLNYRDPMDYKGPEFDDEIIFMLKEYVPGDVKNLYQPQIYSIYSSIVQNISSDEKLNELTGSETGIMQDIKKALPVLAQVENLNKLTPEEEQLLNSLSLPLFKEAFYATRAEVQKKFDEAMAKGGYVIADTPKAANDKLLEVIIEQYKGKALFIDFWATWCGPCLGAMKAIKPFKPEMKEKGVEVIYISGESSPKGKWMNMLPDIGGVHYYLTNEQWGALCKKYEITGIPGYIIVDKKGNITYKKTGFPGVDTIKEELSKVW